MSILDSITPGVGSLLGGALNFFGQTQTNEATAERADQSNVWSAAQYAKRYQTQVADLKKAGLNPMLAYSQSPGSAPSAQQVQFQNPMASASQAYSAIRGSEAQASQAETSAFSASNQAKLIDANVDKIQEEVKNIPLEGRRLERLSALLAEQLNVAFQETQSKIKAREVMTATIKKLGSETTLLDNQAAVEASLDNLGRTSKEVAPLASILLDIVRASRR